MPKYLLRPIQGDGPQIRIVTEDLGGSGRLFHFRVEGAGQGTLTGTIPLAHRPIRKQHKIKEGTALHECNSSWYAITLEAPKAPKAPKKPKEGAK